MNLESAPDPLEHGSGAKTPASQRVPAAQKLAYGAGGLSDFLYVNFAAGLATPILSMSLKMDPFLVAMAFALWKIVGAFCDPIVGALSDNARTRWGRRRPFILIGGLIGVVVLPLIWMPPVSSDRGMFLWVSGLLVVFAVGYSIFSIPYGALGYQMTTNYDERTRVFTWRGYVLIAGTLGAGWFYWLCRRFDNDVVGARWVSVLVGLVILGGVLATVLCCREKITVTAKQPSVPLGKAFRMTVRNRPFMLLQAVVLIIALGTGCEGMIGSYVHIYYTCQGSQDFASYISGLGGTFTTISNLIALQLGLWISVRSGKRTAALVGLGLSLLAICLLPFTLVPKTPYLIIVSWVILSLGMPAASLMFGSITADITDEDEYETGMRREGMFSAVGGFFGKIAGVITILLSGWLPHLAGYSNAKMPPTQEQLEIMKWMLIGIQAISLAAAIFLLWFFPLTRAKSEAIRDLLDERKRAESKNALAKPEELA